MSRLTPDADALSKYDGAGYQLIPLHPWDFVDDRGRQRGKSPRDSNWTTKPYRNADVLASCDARGANAGVRLTAAQLVVDVDPRNFPEGRDSFRELCDAVGLDPDVYPRVETGAGGHHLYMTKPSEVPVVDSLPEYPGVEFKTLGRQVVAAGSVHPNGAPYEWDFLSPSIEAARAAPEGLLSLIARRQRSEKRPAESAQRIPDDVLARALEALDVCDFRDHDRWLRVMMACHHASGGDGREQFVAWSTGDPQYADQADVIRARWSSLESTRANAVTVGTLVHELTEAGRRDLAAEIARGNSDVEADFDELGDGNDRAGSLNPVDALVHEMNERFCAVLDGGQFAIFMRDNDPAFDRPVWTRLTREAFRHYFEDERVPLPDQQRGRASTKAEIWLGHAKRRKYEGIVLDPRNLAENRRKLNLWQGWGVDPKPGDWPLMRELIEDVLCDGDPRSSDYVMRWVAFMLQRPWVTPEAAIAFRGEEGTGKGTLGRALLRIAGQHGLTVASPSQLAGRFNSHLRDCVFLFADEALWPGDKSAEGALKQLVTEPVISYEAKGKDLVSGRNMVHLMLASNEEWVVPAGPTARRFFVSDVSSRRRGDRAFFERLNKELDDGGLAAMVHDLSSLDLEDWHPSRAIPQTSALADQKLQSLDAPSKFWLSVLSSGELPFIADEQEDWTTGPVAVGPAEKSSLVEAYDAFLKRNRVYSARATLKALLKSARAFGVDSVRSSGGGVRPWVLPPLPEMRTAFERAIGAEQLFD